MLCADDYAISDAVSTGIEELAAAGRLSAISAMVTFREWPQHGVRLAHLRGTIAIGLHLNLTAGAPLGPMPNLAPAGTLPTIGTLSSNALRGAVDAGEIEAEALRQLVCFTEYVGHPPDFLDGHQHAHALPKVRTGVVTALRRLGGRWPILLRNPTERPSAIMSRGLFWRKATMVGGLSAGFGKAARAAGHPINVGFSGFSDFDFDHPYARELEANFVATGPRHLMMCHPGYTDDLLATRDSVTTRRKQELQTLLAAEHLSERLWRPDRSKDDLWETWRD